MSKLYKAQVQEYFKNYMAIVKFVKDIIRRIDPEAEVYVFGSLVTGRYTGASDIDVLVVTKAVEEKYEMMVRVYKATDAPVELHIVTRRQFEDWYKRFIPEEELVRV